MENINIALKTTQGIFNYRVGAIIIDSGKILMVKNSGQEFYYSIGGRVKFGESTKEAVLREAFEETNINFEIDKLAFIHENFFIWEKDNEQIHEIAFFYILKSNKYLKDFNQKTFKEEYGEVTLHWLPIKNLKNYEIYPVFFKDELLNPVNNVKHYITRD